MIKRVIKLSSMIKYTHRKALIDAVLDEDFKTRYSKILADGLRKNNKSEAFLTFNILQNAMSVEDLNKVASALDYYGFMYDYTTKAIPFSTNCLYHEHTHCENKDFIPEYARPKTARPVGYYTRRTNSNGSVTFMFPERVHD